MTKNPSPRNLLALLLLAFGCAEVSGEEVRDETVPDGPNIILIMVDDMGWSDIGCFGSEIKTTNIDRLAKEGLLITQFYNNAKCTTTRASLLTGLYPRNVGHRW